ncbi:hypothetical protein EUTSA_v10015598mg, partial [Eutrema salsugineum]
MGLCKLVIKRLAHAQRRQSSFSKRRSGLLKKARQLSTLCKAEVAVIVFSNSGKLFQFSSTGMTQTLMRYENYQLSTDAPLITSKAAISHAYEISKLQERHWYGTYSPLCCQFHFPHLQGKKLNIMSMKVLQHLEHQLNAALISEKERN